MMTDVPSSTILPIAGKRFGRVDTATDRGYFTNHTPLRNLEFHFISVSNLISKLHPELVGKRQQHENLRGILWRQLLYTQTGREDETNGSP